MGRDVRPTQGVVLLADGRGDVDGLPVVLTTVDPRIPALDGERLPFREVGQAHVICVVGLCLALHPEGDLLGEVGLLGVGGDDALGDLHDLAGVLVQYVVLGLPREGTEGYADDDDCADDDGNGPAEGIAITTVIDPADHDRAGDDDSDAKEEKDERPGCSCGKHGVPFG